MTQDTPTGAKSGMTSSPYNLGSLTPADIDPSCEAILDLSRAQPRRFTFAALDSLANQIAAGLMSRGFKRDDVVAIVGRNSAEYLAVVFGAQRAGMVVVPINFKSAKQAIGRVLADSAAKIVFTDEASRDRCGRLLPLVSLDGTGQDGLEAFLQPGSFVPVMPVGNQPAIILYTSGSTGQPKGVVLSHASHLWVLAMRRTTTNWREQRVLIAAPLFHMNALGAAQLSIASGGRMVLMPQFDALAYVTAIASHRCTCLTGVPTMIAMALQVRTTERSLDLSCVQIVRMGSAPLSERLISQVRAAFPTAAISNAYGTTESGQIAFSHVHPAGLPRPEMSVGCADTRASIRLIRRDGLEAEEGVLQIRSPALMNGYHNQPELTARVMTDDGYYVTGDIFRRDENGFYFFVGRADDMFVCGGENIYPSEVEAMLESHPDIEQACVVPLEDEIKGQKPVAFVVTRSGSSIDESVVKQHALDNAPPFQHPRRVYFLDSMPMAGTNKIDRSALHALALRR